MNLVSLSRTYSEPPFREKEILRYALCAAADEKSRALLRECIEEVRGKLSYKVCCCLLPVKTEGDVSDFGAFSLRSEKLALCLRGCRKAIVFAATVGIEIDRLIARYGRLSPSRALMLQAIGTERIEALSDAFCADIKEEFGLSPKPRFSPGYGDLPLSAQKDIFALLEPQRKIGLTLNGSLLMSPTKSVTAFVGLAGEEGQSSNKCGGCDKTGCAFRGA